MSLSRDASLLLDHSPKIGAGIVVVAGFLGRRTIR